MIIFAHFYTVRTLVINFALVQVTIRVGAPKNAYPITQESTPPRAVKQGCVYHYRLFGVHVYVLFLPIVIYPLDQM